HAAAPARRVSTVVVACASRRVAPARTTASCASVAPQSRLCAVLRLLRTAPLLRCPTDTAPLRVAPPLLRCPTLNAPRSTSPTSEFSSLATGFTVWRPLIARDSQRAVTIAHSSSTVAGHRRRLLALLAPHLLLLLLPL
ncbi:hypothetical protein U1Q18_009474, partial [Sarracenia purpurea var. burkii]